MKAEHGATRGPALLFRTTPNFTEPAPAAPPIPGMGTDAHSAQEALDKVAQEPSFLGKVANMAQPYLAKLDATTQPYVEKVQTTTKPYTDAAAVKARELMDKIDGPGNTAPGTTTHIAAQGGDGVTAAPGSTRSVAAPSGTVPGPGEHHGVFDQVAKSVSDFTHKIDERTASGNKPGLITQLTSAVQSLTDKADSYISSHAPTATNVTSTTGHPVQTTTNTVPHTDKPLAAVPQGVPTAQSTAALAPGAGTVPPAAVPGAAGAL